MKKFIMPMVNSGVMVAFLAIIMLQDNIICIAGLLAIGFLFIIPTVSFVYSKRFIKDISPKFPYTLYDSLVITLPYFLFCFGEPETYVYALVVFLWSELWGVLGTLKRKKTRAYNGEG
jgi:hypothetical protein